MIIARGGIVKLLVLSWVCRDDGCGGCPEIMSGISRFVCVIL